MVANLGKGAFALWALVALVPATGCVVDRGARAEIDSLRRQVDVSRRQAAAAQHKADELENRLFVLEDKFDTRNVTQDRGTAAPRLPVVKKPAASAPTSAREPAAATYTDRYTDSDGDEVVVIYEGDAAERGSRPNLRLHQGNRADDMIPVEEPAARTGPRPRRGRTAPLAAETPAPAARDESADLVVPGGDEPISVYKTSSQALSRREHAAAKAGFRRFLERWPSHDYADNAQYWLGEAFYDERDYKAALTEFRKVVKRYADGNKAPDALLKIGYCYGKLGDLDSARDVLSQVVEIYPKTEAAKLAATRLEELRQDANQGKTGAPASTPGATP